MTVYNCNPEWPVCLYDFSFKNRVPNYFCFKVAKNLNQYVLHNYFFNDLPKIKESADRGHHLPFAATDKDDVSKIEVKDAAILNDN